MTRITRRNLLRSAAGGAIALPFSLDVPVSALAGDVASSRIRFAWWTDVGRPTPFQILPTGPGGAVLLTLLYDTLTWKDGTGIIPWLASTWQAADDGLAYTFHLIEGATWHDGIPVTAADVAFSYDYYARHPFVWTSTEVVASVEVVSPSDVTIRLKRPSAPFLEEVAGTVPIIPRHVWETVADPLQDERLEGLTGSGPFKLAEYDTTAGAYRLTANETYWRGKPRTGEWRQITISQETQFAALQQGEADVALSTDASVRDLLAADERLTVFETAPLSMVRLVVNLDRSPLDRREVRQAIAYALDRTRIAETITRGPAIVGSAGVVAPETPWYNPSQPRYDFDTDMARSLLAGETLKLELLADASAREPDLIAPILAEAGIEVNVQRADAATRADLIAEGNFDLALTAHIGGGGDPDYLRRWFTDAEANTFARGPIFQHAEFVQLADEQATTLDAERRMAIIFRMQEILATELPTIVLYHRRFYWVHDATVFTPMATWGGLLNGIPFPNNKLALLEG
jgi:peptide/nickel transport system substrate-binding protein